MPNPHSETPWIKLLESCDDHAFITTMGFDVATFKAIISSGFGTKWYTSPIPHTDTSTVGQS